MSDREVMQQALEALQFIPASGSMLGAQAEVKRVRAIAALRAALAEPEPEPVAWMDRFGSVVVVKGPYETFTTPLYTTPPARRQHAEIASLKAECDALREFVASMIRCRYPVCPTIDPSGYGWDIPRLNEVIDAAIDAVREAGK